MSFKSGMMGDMLPGLPKCLPRSDLPKSNRLMRELMSLGIIRKIEEFKPTLIDDNLEDILKNRIKQDDEQALFQLGQIYFEQERYEKAWKCFEEAKNKFDDQRAKYQLAAMLYDGLIGPELSKTDTPKVDACTMFTELTKLQHGPGTPDGQDKLVYSAAYNLARAYHEGHGVHPSDESALKYFTLAANDGDPNASILAQTALGYMYSSVEFRDLAKAFYWHTQACGNGSVESQAALGIMYLYGLGVPENWDYALFCLYEATYRGSLYAKANLIYLYYKRKMFTNACHLASKLATLSEEDIQCNEPNCLQTFHHRAVSMACFLYALCLKDGKGVQKDENLSKELFEKSVKFDPALATRYQRMVVCGEL